MNIPRIADVLGLIDEDLLDTELPKRRRRGRTVRILLTAACVCLVVGTVTALAAGAGTTLLAKLRKGEDGGFESGYDMAAQLTPFPEEALTGDIREVPAILRRQLEEAAPWSDQLPNTCYRQFDTAAQALAYVGLEELRPIRWDVEETGTTLSVFGGARGEITDVSIMTYCRKGEVRLQAQAWLRTENDSTDNTFGVRTTEDVDYTEERFTAAGGFDCHVIRSTALESGNVTYDGCIVRAGILYTLHAAYPPSEEAQADQLLHIWADQFEPETR